eukprot:TRINITY_DN5587_c0_g1_i3.p1 TRINITY_DN5587_c0_g1~~TRINITY_DN5587_c0_g1_i3.p1  ORF type:complete len:583 (+),score=86.86 TRINITY_DN5587_c0_g1_i3:83-1831(+)
MFSPQQAPAYGGYGPGSAVAQAVWRKLYSLQGQLREAEASLKAESSARRRAEAARDDERRTRVELQRELKALQLVIPGAAPQAQQVASVTRGSPRSRCAALALPDSPRSRGTVWSPSSPTVSCPLEEDRDSSMTIEFQSSSGSSPWRGQVYPVDPLGKWALVRSLSAHSTPSCCKRTISDICIIADVRKRLEASLQCEESVLACCARPTLPWSSRTPPSTQEQGGGDSLERSPSPVPPPSVFPCGFPAGCLEAQRWEQKGPDSFPTTTDQAAVNEFVVIDIPSDCGSPCGLPPVGAAFDLDDRFFYEDPRSSPELDIDPRSSPVLELQSVVDEVAYAAADRAEARHLTDSGPSSELATQGAPAEQFDAQVRDEGRDEARSVAAEHSGVAVAAASYEKPTDWSAGEALFVDNISFWVAAFAPQSWAPVCSKSAHFVRHVLGIYVQGWRKVFWQMIESQTMGAFDLRDSQMFGPEPGWIYCCIQEVRDLKAAIRSTSFDLRKIMFYHRWVLHMDFLITMYEEIRLRHKELYLLGRRIAINLLDVLDDTLSPVLDAFNQRTAAAIEGAEVPSPPPPPRPRHRPPV